MTRDENRRRNYSKAVAGTQPTAVHRVTEIERITNGKTRYLDMDEAFYAARVGSNREVSSSASEWLTKKQREIAAPFPRACTAIISTSALRNSALSLGSDRDVGDKGVSDRLCAST